ncbi:hypothetical protein QGM71_01150 [Virgibacillus sp. C22-A2]|uniref:Uncharacterized protein n=1 Tax=Virgibacillus tibetensis TaxID=3042313 RepID=A0ABU6KA26_9BACI|nr:hypothetical protein [Virgibacillus sp. C22-A2]
MKTYETHDEMKRTHVIEQLEKFGSYNNDHYTYQELKIKLAAARAMDIDITHDDNKFF